MSHIHTNFSSTLLSPNPLKPTKHHHHHHHHHLHLLFSSFHLSHSSSLSPSNLTTYPLNRNVVFKASLEKNSPPSISVDQNSVTQSGPWVSASDVVRSFYGGINRHDLASVEPLIAQNCVYEDLIFSQPFVGRKSILEFFGKFIDSISTDLQFVIDAISEEDSSAVGVTWHLEWKGKPFPFSKGCSFYQLEVVNGVQQIIYARDSVEPAFKPGESALIAIRGVTWLLQRFPKLQEWL